MYCAALPAASNGKRVGTSIMLHVMPGDQFDLSTDYYVPSAPSGQQEDLSTMLSTLITVLSGGMGVVGVGDGADYTKSMLQNNTSYADIYRGIVNNATTSGKPHAYLNYMVYDEEFNLQGTGQSGALQIGATQSSWDHRFRIILMPIICRTLLLNFFYHNKILCEQNRIYFFILFPLRLKARYFSSMMKEILELP